MLKEYSLDSQLVVKVLGIEFIDDFTFIKIKMEKYKDLSVKERYLLIKRVLLTVESSSSKGFLTSHDLTKFPVLSEILPSFLMAGSEIERDECIRGRKSQSEKYFPFIYSFLEFTSPPY